ncbi:MAG TPA: RagB/SusD family nutrient uptake outer membrane protein, partial [Bacteroidales bacterium]|nr:RagB/SusD family nutrient uptake outer membrane protein [Bacteroidales bacterium]
MKKKYFIIVFILVLVNSFSSCEQEEFFELTNPPEFPWLNITEFERAVVSPYHYSFMSSWGGMFYISDIVLNDCMTDLVYHIPGASASYPSNEIYNRQTNVEIDRASQAFGVAYNSIGLINAALNFYYSNNENPFPDASQEDVEHNLKRIIGELHFMRAFAYFYLAVRHCPVPGAPDFANKPILPFRKDAIDAERALNPEFVTTDVIYDFIIEDIKVAIGLLPVKYIDGLHHPSYQYGRINQFGAKAFLSRIYFRMGEYEKALAEVDEVIRNNDGMFSLNQDPIEAWNRSDASRGNEVIWQAIYYDKQLGVTPKDATLFTFLDYRAENGGHGEYFKRSTWHLFSMSNSAAQKLGWMDEEYGETEEAIRDKRYQQLYHRLEGHRGSFADDPDVYEQQYFNVTEPRIWGDKYFRGPDGQYTNVPVIRLSEMYLTRAILRFKNGDKQGAADD